MYALVQNRVFKVFVMLLLVVTFTVVPTENRLQDAKTAYAVAIADDAVIAVVVGVLVGMGLWNAYKGVATSDSKPFDNGAMRALAKKCIDNIPELYRWGLTVATGIDVKALINVPKAIYKLIKDYLETEYADEGIAEGISKDSDLVALSGTIFVQGQPVYSLDALEEYSGSGGLYSISEIGGATFSYNVNGYNDDTGLFSIDCYCKKVSSTGLGDRTPIKSPRVDVGFYAFYRPGVTLTSTGITLSVQAFYDGNSRRSNVGYNNFGVNWASVDEYAYALSVISGDNGLSLDEVVFNSEYAPYIKAYTDIANYLDATAADITSINAKLDGLASNVVNTSAQSIHWTGGITDCPIDDLKSQLEDLVTSAPAIGDWTCSWDKSGTLCDISVTDISTGEKVADISGDVAISWTDVATEIGVSTDSKADTDVDTDSKVDTDTKTDTGELTMPDDKTKIDLKPLQIAGELFCTRFPFCLPFDLYNAFTQFKIGNGSKQAPVITIPIDLSDFGYYEIELDLSVFDDNAVLVVRWSTYLSFMVLMIYVTNKLIGRG